MCFNPDLNLQEINLPTNAIHVLRSESFLVKLCTVRSLGSAKKLKAPSTKAYWKTENGSAKTLTDLGYATSLGQNLIRLWSVLVLNLSPSMDMVSLFGWQVGYQTISLVVCITSEIPKGCWGVGYLHRV